MGLIKKLFGGKAKPSAPQPPGSSAPQPLTSSAPQQPSGPRAVGPSGPRPVSTLNRQPPAPQPLTSSAPQAHRSQGHSRAKPSAPQPPSSSAPQHPKPSAPQPHTSSAPQPPGSSAHQPLGYSAPQPFHPSAPQPPGTSAHQPPSPPAPQPLNPSAPQLSQPQSQFPSSTLYPSAPSPRPLNPGHTQKASAPQPPSASAPQPIQQPQHSQPLNPQPLAPQPPSSSAHRSAPQPLNPSAPQGYSNPSSSAPQPLGYHDPLGASAPQPLNPQPLNPQPLNPQLLNPRSITIPSLQDLGDDEVEFDEIHSDYQTMEPSAPQPPIPQAPQFSAPTSPPPQPLDPQPLSPQHRPPSSDFKRPPSVPRVLQPKAVHSGIKGVKGFGAEVKGGQVLQFGVGSSAPKQSGPQPPIPLSQEIPSTVVCDLGELEAFSPLIKALQLKVLMADESEVKGKTRRKRDSWPRTIRAVNGELEVQDIKSPGSEEPFSPAGEVIAGNFLTFSPSAPQPLSTAFQRRISGLQMETPPTAPANDQGFKIPDLQQVESPDPLALLALNTHAPSTFSPGSPAHPSPPSVPPIGASHSLQSSNGSKASARGPPFEDYPADPSGLQQHYSDTNQGMDSWAPEVPVGYREEVPSAMQQYSHIPNPAEDPEPSVPQPSDNQIVESYSDWNSGGQMEDFGAEDPSAPKPYPSTLHSQPPGPQMAQLQAPAAYSQYSEQVESDGPVGQDQDLPLQPPQVGEPQPAPEAVSPQAPKPHPPVGAGDLDLPSALMQGPIAKLLKKKKTWEDKYAVLSCKPREGAAAGGEIDFAYLLEVYETKEAAGAQAEADPMHIVGATVKFAQGTVFTIATTGEFNKKGAKHFLSTNTEEELRAWFSSLEVVPEITVDWVGQDGVALQRV